MENFSPHSLPVLTQAETNNFKIENPFDEEDKEANINNNVFMIDVDIQQFLNHKRDESEVIAIEGKTFEKLLKIYNKYKETNNDENKPFYDIFRYILKNSTIYARMDSENKTLLIEALREEGFTVCMCGDGANDCGALRSADVGISLSLEEASIAAHFTSNVPDISCVIRLLREGKASLVTCVLFFKYMMAYSLVQFFAITILMLLNTYFSDNQLLICDLGVSFPLTIFLARTGAYDKLTFHIPTLSLISVPILSSIFIQVIFQLLSLVDNNFYIR